jgi:hypothetical protein
VIDDRFKNIRSSLTTILFLATPHKGSASADLLGIVASIANIAMIGNTRVVGRTRTDLIKSLGRDSQVLTNIAGEFRFQTDKFDFYSFIEQNVTPPMKDRVRISTDDRQMVMHS